MICISETYFYSSELVDDKGIKLDRHNLTRVDHPNNTIRGGVCIYCKESSSIKVLDVPSINECLLCKVSVKKKYNCSEPPAFKNQRVGYPSNQKFLHHISIQKISSILKFILQIQSILESHHQTGHSHF